MTCDRGVLRARLSGTSTESGVRVLGAVVEGLYQPRLLPLELALGWSVDMVDASGQRATVSGSLAAAGPSGQDQ